MREKGSSSIADLGQTMGACGSDDFLVWVSMLVKIIVSILVCGFEHRRALKMHRSHFV